MSNKIKKQYWVKIQKKEKSYARKFNLLTRKIKKEDERTEELLAQISMFQKELLSIQGKVDFLKTEELKASGFKS